LRSDQQIARSPNALNKKYKKISIAKPNLKVQAKIICRGFLIFSLGFAITCGEYLEWQSRLLGKPASEQPAKTGKAGSD